MSAPIEGVVICGATAAMCTCTKPVGHVEDGDEIHACNPKACTGQWTGTFGEDGWTPVVAPTRVEVRS